VLDPPPHVHVLVPHAVCGHLARRLGGALGEFGGEFGGNALVGVADVDPRVLVRDVLEPEVALFPFGVEVPLSDVFLWGTPAAPLDKIESAMNAGQDYVGEELCDHYAFRQANADWQIWIATGSRPLPRKVVITNRTDEARPQSMSLIDWNLKPAFKDAVFKFTAPKGAKKIDIVPVKTK